MSIQPISHNTDIKKLIKSGYEIRITGTHLMIKSVPYVDSNKGIKWGALVSTLALSENTVNQPDTHIVMWAGERPCDENGKELKELSELGISHDEYDIGQLKINYKFSHKPKFRDYKDYYEKMTTYINIISGHAQKIDPNVTAKTFGPVVIDDPQTVFQYLDTCSSRAGIEKITEKLSVEKIAIVGLGGTGSYILDLLAKTPINEIHLYDGDIFSQHNAFRAPGAAPLSCIKQKMKKVDYFQKIYSAMHKGIKAHPNYIDDSNINELSKMDFVFLSMDGNKMKKKIIDTLEKEQIDFIDVGLGLGIDSNQRLGGLVRITTRTNENRQKKTPLNHAMLSEGTKNDDIYSTNIQASDMNALNATLAVIKWKKLRKFYKDTVGEHQSLYIIHKNKFTDCDTSTCD